MRALADHISKAFAAVMPPAKAEGEL